MAEPITPAELAVLRDAVEDVRTPVGALLSYDEEADE